MVMHLELKINMGLPAGRYLAKSDFFTQIENVDKKAWATVKECGYVELREATYEEQTHFIENGEGGIHQILPIQ